MAKRKKKAAESDNSPHEKREKFERQLRVILSRDQVEEYADRAAHLLQERDDREVNLKAAQKQAKAEIDAIDAKFREISGYVRDKAKYQDVVCERVFDYAIGVVREVRLDTGIVLSERAMTAEERQLGLDLEDDTPDDKSLEDDFSEDGAAAE